MLVIDGLWKLTRAAHTRSIRQKHVWSVKEWAWGLHLVQPSAKVSNPSLCPAGALTCPLSWREISKDHGRQPFSWSQICSETAEDNKGQGCRDVSCFRNGGGNDPSSLVVTFTLTPAEAWQVLDIRFAWHTVTIIEGGKWFKGQNKKKGTAVQQESLTVRQKNQYSLTPSNW